MWTTLLWMMVLLAALHGLGLWRNSRRLWRRMHASPPPQREEGWGPVAVLAPVKGIDPDFRATLASLLHQDFAAPYDLIFALASDADPAHELIASEVAAAGAAGTLRARQVLRINAGDCHDRGQKVHNLTVAVSHLATDVRALCFIDSDARPAHHWLTAMTAPLQQEGVGATTGFRWYLPERGGQVMPLACLWNSLALGVVARDGRNFAWGGSMAIRRDTFDQCDLISRYWAASVSDDGGLTRAVHDAKLIIRFVPSCLLPSLHDMKATELWEFITRQFIITRFYLPGFFRAGLIIALIDIAGFWLALAYACTLSLEGEPPVAMILLLLVTYGAYIQAGRARYEGSRKMFPEHAAAVRATRNLLVWGGPLVPLLNAAATLTALTRRSIVWRKIRYTFRPSGALQIEHPPQAKQI